jgi:hypothetical protein
MKESSPTAARWVVLTLPAAIFIGGMKYEVIRDTRGVVLNESDNMITMVRTDEVFTEEVNGGRNGVVKMTVRQQNEVGIDLEY